MNSASSMHEVGHSKCSGTIQKDGVGREVGVGFRMGGTHMLLWLIHINVWQNLQYYKATILQLK